MAAAMLLRTGQPVIQIGYSIGWPDQNHFGRRFKAHHGVAGSTYRTRLFHTAVRMQSWSTTHH
jgi:AraC family L-rhamnose operon transcriptional activator RhaR